jgi:hypothetical protein
VPSDAHVTVTVKVAPLLASGAYVHEEAVPVFEKSAEESPVTDSDRARVRSNMRTMYELFAEVNELTAGTVLSITIEVVDAIDRLPAPSMAYR